MKITLEQLCHALVVSGIIYPEAIDDPEGFDNWATVERIEFRLMPRLLKMIEENK